MPQLMNYRLKGFLPLPIEEERKWQQQQWGRKKDYSCFCDHFCPSKLWGLALAPLTVESSPANHRPLVAVLSLHADLLMRYSKELVAVWVRGV
ncbi:uncharacterized protein [Pyrus communis]|uniref:uncharacterized protein isoform X2 n=1 Tax=Pyrus communis TaxID=23211 RepID=UPI0035BF9FF7